ncbi:MAG: carboxypeptidase-like regulatory domain-containing protein, partial [Anaerolineaceae bacterium]|nr:carboxypeptidase-like regulatory domain-containing protein [Anaerolineaceae bacterium]
MAYAVEIRSTDTFYKIPDLDAPGTWQAIASAATYYAGDFLEGDFSKIYAVSELNVLHTIDATTGFATEIMPLATPEGYGYQGIAGAEGFFYGTSSDCDTETLISTINPTTGEIVVVVETAIACGIDIAYAPDRGLLYIVDIVTDHLYSVDPVTETVVDVGALGFEAGFAQGMDYDEATQILYWAAYGSGGNGQLRTINMNTGASTLVGAFPGDNETDCLSIATYAGGGDYEINGTVRSETGLLLEGAKVVINPDGEGFPRTAYTDELGAYSAAVDAGTYSLTASKLGYLNETKTATVPEGATAPVIVDFALDVIPATSISGTVTDGGIIDGSMHGYPLLATVVFKAADHTLETQTDPFTGEYAIEIFASTDYQVTVTAALPGYLPARRDLVGAFDAVQDFTLNVDAGACSAPGYAPDYAYFFDFETGPQEFTFGGTNSSWAWGEFTSGPGEAMSGTKGIATNPAGQYNNSEQSWAMSPVLDLSGVGVTETVLLEWWNWIFTESATSTWDVASLEFTKNGGTTWTTVWGPFPRQDTQYKKELIEIDPSYFVADFQFRFWFKTDSSGLQDGWYIDNIGLGWLTVDPTVTEVASFHFDDGTEPAWTTGGSGITSWAKGIPTTGPGAARSTPNVWATNLNGNYNASEVSFITSPVMDFSEHAGSAITVSYWDWLQTESITSNWDVGRLKASADGGATFTTLVDNIKRKDTVGAGLKAQSFQLSPSFTTDKFQFRFEFKSDVSGQYLGWYIDDVSFGVAEPAVIPCGIVEGGIVAGYVFDANFPEVKLMGATVATDTNAAVTDPSLDGLYYMFQAVESDPENVQFTISYPNYETKTETREIDQDVVNRQDFELDAGLIISSPLALERTIFLHDDPEFTTLTLINEGAGGANFAIREVDKGFQPYSIPVFTGKLEPSQEPVSISRDPNASKVVGGPELNALSVQYSINAAPPAYGIDLFTDSLYNWPDAAAPGTSNLVGTPSATSVFAGDFMGADFDTLYAISYDNNKLYAIDTATAVATEIGTTV